MGNRDLVPVRSGGTVVDLISSLKPQFAAALPKSMTVERFARIALTCLRTNPKLAECTTPSLMGALMTCAQLGLEPGGPSGRAYLVPYGNTVTFIVGYRGLIELAYRHPEVAGIEARIVRERDKFLLRYGTQLTLEHEPALRDPGEMVGAYAVVRLRTGEPVVEWMDRAQIDAIRKRSRASGSGPWVSDYEEMARKTVLRRALKYAPSLVEVATATAAEDSRTVWDPEISEVRLEDPEPVREPGEEG